MRRAVRSLGLFCFFAFLKFRAPVTASVFRVSTGVRNLPWLFTATFVTLIVAQPLSGALVAKLPRARFIPIADAGHYPQIEQPRKVVEAIEYFARENLR